MKKGSNFVKTRKQIGRRDELVIASAVIGICLYDSTWIRN
jgi:hypothetical protein